MTINCGTRCRWSTEGDIVHVPKLIFWLTPTVKGNSASGYGFQRALNLNAYPPPPSERADFQVQAYLELSHHTMVPPGQCRLTLTGMGHEVAL